MGEAPEKRSSGSEEAPFPLTDVDRWVLSQTDDEFKKHDWDDLKLIIETNRLDTLKRKPSDLRRYMKWTSRIKAEYGSMTQYILANRLPQEWGQPPFTPASTVPFANSSDYKVLINDWPYGLESGISHLVVWSRTPIPVDAETGDVTPQSRAGIENFVQRYFIDTLGPGGGGQVLWFKNWVALQSVRALEHFHVLVRNVDEDTLERWTGERPKPPPQ
ncbi:hypothetical protein S7711_03037 [Stachybotrys chartarum IBT 7711]|uniref:N-acetylglucosamine-induced protein 1 n=1 Tax=Stachybotrys chartarum (strain CBS 109288 / IBT 7711) TaxID=1280523 RepID=A0A084APE8_STACB|nr:hypothetical protein S7711_03037 [Stachybotrys chartarum IBT 7711]KFA46791.1 hypothetical protein S40293_06809 [Stachybotrys chartarum IBT 40293]KFA73304.1 hypothetical protein S40288_09256 [Stachybotrys chartarum IBT 40288]